MHLNHQFLHFHDLKNVEFRRHQFDFFFRDFFNFSI